VEDLVTDAPASPTLDAYDLIPKVELHCHVEGAVRPATAAELARRNGRPLPSDDPAALYRYGSLEEFIQVYSLVQDTLKALDDWERIAYEALLDAAPHGLRYREMFFSPTRHLAAGQGLQAIVAGLSTGIAAAEAETGVRCMLIANLDRSFPGTAGRELVERIGELRRAGGAERIIGIGTEGSERTTPLADLADAFALAARLGLRRSAHLAQVGGPQEVATAREVLGVERVDHGVGVMEDPALVRRLAEERVPFTVCPTSNVLIAHRYPSLREHPFRRMREAGLLAMLNTDDPAMIDLNPGKEYREVARAQGLDFDDLAAVALDGVEASWLDEGDKRALRAAFTAQLDTVRDRFDAPS
jgi:adenosine deaminase